MGRCEEIVDELFSNRDWYEIPSIAIAWSEDDKCYKRKKCVERLTRYNIIGLATRMQLAMLSTRSEFMADGSWNDDAVNLIILDEITKKMVAIGEEEHHPSWYGYGKKEPVEDQVRSALKKRNDSRIEDKMEYFEKKLEIMRDGGYLERYVPYDNPLFGYFALVR